MSDVPTLSLVVRQRVRALERERVEFETHRCGDLYCVDAHFQGQLVGTRGRRSECEAWNSLVLYLINHKSHWLWKHPGEQHEG